MGARVISGGARNEEGRPAGRPMEFPRDAFPRRHLPETRNSGCGTAMFWGRLLNGGYSGASNHSRRYSPASMRLTVASQKPSNSRFSFQYAASTLAPTRRVSRATALSGLALAGAAGVARAGSGELALAAPMFVFCSETGFGVGAAAI